MEEARSGRQQPRSLARSRAIADRVQQHSRQEEEVHQHAGVLGGPKQRSPRAKDRPGMALGGRNARARVIQNLNPYLKLP